MGEIKDDKKEQLRHYMNLIEKQSGAIVRPYREDGYINLLNKYGTERDTTEHYQFHADPEVPDSQLTEFYENNGLFAKIIDAPAEEAVKHGFEMKGSDEEIEDLYKEALNKLEWEETAITSIKWARLFGGSLAVMLIDDGGSLEDPVNWQEIKSIDDMRVYDRSIVVPDETSIYTSNTYGDPFNATNSKLGYPEYYNVFSMYGTFRVHESRCLIFRNGVLSERSSNPIYRQWGIPEYMRISRAVRDAEVAHGSAVKLLDRAVQAVYSMKGLSAELATEGGESRLLQRLQMIDMARGLMNTITVDADGEEYSFRQFSFSGVSEVIDTTCNYLSALTNIPQTVLFGRSPAGMNATGQGDMENWYNYVERIQKKMLKNNLRYLLAIIFQAALNNGIIEEPPILEVEFKPLWSLSEQEQMAVDQQKASIAQIKAGTAQMYVDMQVLDPSEVRTALAKEEDFDIDTMLDEYTPEELEENAPAGDDQMGMMGGMMGGMPGGGIPPGMGGGPDGGGAPGGGAPDGMPGGQEQMAAMMQQGQMPPQNAKNGPNQGDKQKGEEIAEDEAEVNSVGVLIVKDGKVLTGRRLEPATYMQICGPGGKIEENETAEEAAVRETQEEFGITPKSLISLGQGPTEDTGFTPEVFLCTEYEGEITCADGEMSHPRWEDLQDLANTKEELFKPFKSGLSMLMHMLYRPPEKKKPILIRLLDYIREKLSQRATQNREYDVVETDASRGNAGSYDKLTYDTAYHEDRRNDKQ